MIEIMNNTLKYKCLILDHDDTVVDSSVHVHYPAFLVSLAELRPGHTISLEDYFRMNFHPGFIEYCRGVLGFTEAEFDRELEIWKEYVTDHVPTVYPGMAQIICRQKELGGLVCVASHSFEFNIRRDYAANALPEPDAIYGWDLSPACRKPSPWAVEQILKHFELRPEDVLVVDDLKTGYDMACAAGVPFAAACWAYDVPEIRSFMEKNCPLCFSDPAALEQYIFD